MYALALRLDHAQIDYISNYAGVSNRLRMYERALQWSLKALRTGADVPEAQCVILTAAAHCAYWGPEVTAVDVNALLLKEARKMDLNPAAERSVTGGIGVAYWDVTPEASRALAEADEKLNGLVATALPIVQSWASLSQWARSTVLSIGYLARDLRVHPMGYMMQGIFRRHDRSRCESVHPWGG